MDIVLLDTNIISFLLKEDSRARTYASTALLHHIPLVTHNPTDFEIIEEIQLIT